MKGIKHKRQCVSMILFIENFRKDKPVVTENNVYPGPKKEPKESVCGDGMALCFDSDGGFTLSYKHQILPMSF